MIHEADLEHEIEDHIDLTPLIDAMFLLLIFFIMATTFAKPVMDVILPHAESSAKTDSRQDQMLISIDSQGRIFHESREFSLETLPDLLSRHPELPVNFYVDEKAPFKSFVKVLDQARLKKRDQIVISTDPIKKSDEKH